MDRIESPLIVYHKPKTPHCTLPKEKKSYAWHNYYVFDIHQNIKIYFLIIFPLFFLI